MNKASQFGFLRKNSPQQSPMPQPAEQKEPAEQKLCLGVIRGAYGVHGAVRIRSFTQNPLDIAAYGPLSDADDRRHFIIQQPVITKQDIRARLSGITTRAEAAALQGTHLYIARHALPSLHDADSYYHADLLGLEARTKNGDVLGRITAIHDFGAGDVLEVQNPAGDDALFVPFTRLHVPDINLEAGYITLMPLISDAEK